MFTSNLQKTLQRIIIYKATCSLQSSSSGFLLLYDDLVADLSKILGILILTTKMIGIARFIVL